MTLLHPARVGSPVGVWLVDGHPDRIVHGAERFRVVSPAMQTAEGWTFRAVRDDGSLYDFDIVADGADHWTLGRVVDADWRTARRSA
ncbi:MAG TPA: hypothetical protein VN200_07240 [Rhodoglobus sp.]|nr:hypothetical protein [Rhodoglobus sp.]